MLSVLVIAGLIVVWGIVLLPDLLSRISRSRRGDTIRSFNSQLSSLGRSAPVGHADNVIDLRDRMAAPRTAQSQTRPTGSVIRETERPRPVSAVVRKRRQDVLLALGATALLTLLATVAFGSVYLYLHLLADLLLAGYLVLLQRAGAAHTAEVRPSSTSQQYGSARSMGGLAPLSGPAGRAHMLEPRRIAN